MIFVVLAHTYLHASLFHKKILHIAVTSYNIVIGCFSSHSLLCVCVSGCVSPEKQRMIHSIYRIYSLKIDRYLWLRLDNDSLSVHFAAPFSLNLLPLTRIRILKYLSHKTNKHIT